MLRVASRCTRQHLQQLEHDELYIIMYPGEFPARIEPPTRLSPKTISQRPPSTSGLSQPHDTCDKRHCDVYSTTAVHRTVSPLALPQQQLTSPQCTTHVSSQLTKALALSCLLCACRVQGFAFSQGRVSRSCRRSRPAARSAVDAAGDVPHEATAAVAAQGRAAEWRAGWLASPSG